jgi:surface antigen
MANPHLRVGVAALLVIFGTTSLPRAAAFADPPPWAPAYGYREKHHDDGRDRQPVVVAPPPVYVTPAPVVAPAPAIPFGLAQNTCHRDLIGAALGGAAGGLIGSNIGKGSGRTLATVGGVLAGLFVGGAIGRSMDEADQACVGAVLQYAPDHQTVVWQGADQQGYWVTPTRSYESDGRYCRQYESRALVDGLAETTISRACRRPDGSWALVN